MNPTIVAAILTASTITLTLAAPAHADDTTFQNDITQNHITTGIMDPNTVLAYGHYACDHIRDGSMTPDQAAQLPHGPGIDGTAIVTTAQHDLCPDTLHP